MERVPGLVGSVLLGSALAFAAAIQPGPLQAFLVSRVVSTGWKRTLPACLAPVVSDGPIAVVAVVLVGRIPTVAQHLLRASGGLMLLYLAAGAWRRWREPGPHPPVSTPRTLLEAVAVNLLNPNPYLGWALVLGPAVLAAWRQDPAQAFALVAAFYLTMLVTLAAFVFLAGSARRLGPRPQRALVGASALLLAALGAALLVLGLRGL